MSDSGIARGEDSPGGGAPLDGEAVLSELFHENSKQQRHDLEFVRRIEAINASPGIHRILAKAYKVCAGSPRVVLPPVIPGDGLSFERTVARRRSVRDFTGDPIELGVLAKLLFLANGITGRLPGNSGGIDQPLRAAPSAGALYAVELYAVARAVEGLDAGLYHYDIASHALERLKVGDFVRPLGEATSYESVFRGASATLVLSVVFARTRFKYGERGYRFALLEAGHIAQNVLLAATALDVGAVAIGGFIDDEVNDLIGADGVDESSLYVVPVGRPAPASAGSIGVEGPSAVDALLSLLWEERESR